MEISYQNLLALDVGMHIISQLTARDLVLASRVCGSWYHAIKSREEVWTTKFKQIEYFSKHLIVKGKDLKGISTHYEKWRFLINNAFQKMMKEPSILSTPIPLETVQYLTDDPKTWGRYYTINNQLDDVNEITKEEKKELDAKREEVITKINDAFHSALALYSGDVKDKSFVREFIVFAKKEKILLNNRYLFALALFLREGNPDEYFSLEFSQRDHAKAVEELALLSLQQGNDEQALGWVKRYVDSVGKAYKIENTFIVKFGQQVIDAQKSGLLEELLSHLLRLDSPGFRQNALYKQAIKANVLLVLQELHDTGYAEMIDSLAKRLPLQ